MEIKITGDMRTVANSAWISTISEIRAMERSDDDARRVVNFLVENHHTSPFESVTVSFIFDIHKLSDDDFDSINFYMNDIYCRVKDYKTDLIAISIDLLNFIKVSYQKQLFDSLPWNLFSKQVPDLAEVCKKFEPIGSKISTEDTEAILGQHTITVDLVDFHDMEVDELSRATWRITCPLSIAVQILRHRKASFNMASGRYRTLNQDLTSPAKDCVDIFNKANINIYDYLSFGEICIQEYLSTMKLAKKARDDNKISNDEYKRLREFARFILPEGRMTDLYVTFYLDDFKNYLFLRDSEHAQVEHILIAQKMKRTLEDAKK